MQVERRQLPQDFADLSAELEKTRRQLAESEARFRDIIEGNADAIIVVDEDGVVRFANKEASELFRCPVEDLLGTAFGFPVVAGETTELDLHHDGSIRSVEMRVVESHWQGRTACIASLRDITQRKYAEENERELIREQAARGAAEQAVRRFRFLAEGGAELAATLEFQEIIARLARLGAEEIADWAIVYCTDKDQRIRRSAVAHRQENQRSLVELFRDSPLDVPVDHPVEQCIRTGRPILLHQVTAEQLDTLIPNPQSREIALRLGVRALAIVPIMARGRAFGALAVVWAQGDRPFTDQDVVLAENLAARAALAVDNARLYEQAREANQTKTELLAVISHDLRTPLNSVIGYAQLLEMGIPDALPPSSLERVQRILTSSNHLLYLIDELLAFARVEGNHEEVRAASCDVCQVVREVADLMEPLAAEKGLALRAALPQETVVLTTDADKLRQVLVNLVGNAVKYTATGQIELSVERAGGALIFRVADTGPGIPADYLPRIFEPFWQADRSQRAHGGGTGLGLSVVQRVVSLLGGVVRVDSRVGVGSTFEVILPE